MDRRVEDGGRQRGGGKENGEKHRPFSAHDVREMRRRRKRTA